MQALANKLDALGFTEDAAGKGYFEGLAADAGMHDNGPYVVHHVFTKGDVVVVIEQNTAPEDMGGMSAIVSHPACAIIESPKGRVAFNPDDVELAGNLVDELS
jgi:hypothetical protein